MLKVYEDQNTIHQFLDVPTSIQVVSEMIKTELIYDLFRAMIYLIKNFHSP